jgi:hypothetical protein
MVLHIAKASEKLRGADINAIMAEHLESAMTEEDEKIRQSPQVKKAWQLIETMRIVSGDKLTAHDQAIYEMLLATARDDGIEKETHRIAVADIMKYLGVQHVDRVIESLDRIADVRVSYDFKDEEIRRRGKLSLANYEVTENLRAGTAILEYSIPPAVRRIILSSDSFAKLEINAFAKFKCRYTARLYQRLALRASYDAHLRKPWIIDPKQLADELGYVSKKWNYRHFYRDVLVPVLDDIADCVGRFSVLKPAEIRGSGRGRPVEKIVFITSGMEKEFKEIQAAPILRRDKYLIRSPDTKHQPHELPSASAVSRAVTMSGRDPVHLSDAYRTALDKAKANPAADISAGGLPLQGGMLLQTIKKKKDGADNAFLCWARTIAREARLSTQRGNMAPAVEAKPIVVVDTPDYKQTVYPAVRPPRLMVRPTPKPQPVIVDDPFDAIEVTGAVANSGDECPF